MAIHEAAQLQSEEADYTNFVHQVKRVYGVKADTALEAQLSALAQDAPAGLTKLSASTRYTDRKKSRIHWQVEISYGFPDVQRRDVGNPLDWEPKISYPMEEYQETYFEDVDRKKVLNSSKQPFEQMRPRDRSRMVIAVEVTVHDSSFHPLTLASYADTTNQGVVTIDGVSYSARKLRMKAPQASEKKTWTDGTTTVHYRTITFRLLMDPDNQHLDKVADTGFDELVAGKWRPILDEHGQQVSKPFPLDGNGLKSAGDPATLTFRPYADKVWTDADFG